MSSRNSKKQLINASAPAVAVPANAVKPDKATGRTYADRLISPSFAALQAIQGAYGKASLDGLIDTADLEGALRDQAAAVNRNNLSNVEAMLMNQATALQALFSQLTARGMGSNQIPNFEANMRMALRAQSQCRATLETLATIKNPPVILAKQANIAHTQQVNNGVPSAEVAPARTRTRGKKSIQANELITEGAQHGTTLDSGRPGAAICVNQKQGTVEPIDRPDDAGR